MAKRFAISSFLYASTMAPALAASLMHCHVSDPTATPLTSSDQLPQGKSTIRVEFKYDGGGLAKGGVVTMFVNDKKVAEGKVDKTVFGRFSADETFDIGRDYGSPVSDIYLSPFKFSGSLNRVEVDIAPTKLGALELQKIKEAMKATADFAE